MLIAAKIKNSKNLFVWNNFFPKKSYILKVVGKGFARNQIRLMMGTLISLGKNEINLEFIENNIKNVILKPKKNIIDSSKPVYDLEIAKKTYRNIYEKFI